MNVIDIWQSNDLVVKVLILSVMMVAILVFEKTYQYISNLIVMKKLKKLDSLEELDSLKESYIKDTLIEIRDFNKDSKPLLNSFIGVKIDMFEQYMMRYVGAIGLVAVLSPMLGLVGTFIGVWHVFEGVGEIGLNEPTVIALGIKEVIIDTMAGLSVAMIAMIFFKLFELLSNKLVSQYEEKIYKLIGKTYA